ncbi:MAG: bifunctional sterol desaturase/short chain dehydrogenase [Spirulina sp. SIO3F2]|nr:bifunctional sterol desaturase/short chain dehydrogenase [Spirulina sp. SIO3F2]
MDASAGIGAIVAVELVRDSYHALAHVWAPLYRLHVWHHRVFRPDLSVKNDTIYRQAHWYNDVPESLVMLMFSGLWAWLLWGLGISPWAISLGIIYALGFLATGMARGAGLAEWTDFTHKAGPFDATPGAWMVNRSYHWRHHFDDQDAYFCGTLTIVDKFLGTALSLKGKRIAVTGASGTMGRALLQALSDRGAKVTAFTSSSTPITLVGSTEPLPTCTWTIGQEAELAEQLEKIDILILNHGINVHGQRDEAAIARSYEINAFSHWRWLELFLKTVKTNKDIATKEVWINTSEAEVSPAVSPLYELSKRTIGDLVTLKRLDAPCVIRKLVLGPFKSNLNPIGIMSADWVARQIVNLAVRDMRNIIVTVNPLTYVLFPLKEWRVSLYFRWFSQGKVKG